MRKIIVYGNSDKREEEGGFPSVDKFIQYIKNDIFKLYNREYHYSQNKAADVIVLSRDGIAYGYFVTNGKRNAEIKDVEIYDKCKAVYSISKSVLFAKPVQLNQLKITNYQFGKYITEEQLKDIERLAGGKELYYG
jgi:hypothetical protein